MKHQKSGAIYVIIAQKSAFVLMKLHLLVDAERIIMYNKYRLTFNALIAPLEARTESFSS